DARIDQGIGDVTDQLHHQPEQGEDVQGAEHQRVVPVDGRLEAEQAKAAEGEDHLDQQGTGEEYADQGRREAGDDQQHGVAEHVAVEHAVFRQALGAGSDHVLLADLVEEAVLGQDGQGGEAADDHGGDRQHQVPEVVGDLAPGAQCLPDVGSQPAQGEPVEVADVVEEAVLGRHGQGGGAADGHGGDRQQQVPEVVGDLAPGAQFLPVVGRQPARGDPVEVAAAGKQHDQQNGQQEAGNGVADDDQRAGPDIEGRAVADGLADAQGDGDQIG